MINIQKSLIRYQGSKYWMLANHRIHEFIPTCNHDNVYCELFCGSAVMFWNLNFPHMHAYLNDINQDLINFWIHVRDHQDELEKRLKYLWCTSPKLQWDLDLTNKLDRATQFFLTQYHSTFLTKPSKIQKVIDFWSNHLNKYRIYIDSKPFDEAMDMLSKLYKGSKERRLSIRFYEDPPYYGMEKVYKSYYKDGLERVPIKSFDHQLLADKNHEMADKGHTIILSYNKCPEILELYQGWDIKEFDYSPNGKGRNTAKERQELLISNKPLIRRYNKRIQKTLF